ncbi:hypothetical protein BpHYR1_042826 [Brachionus plicatilis]|uniref:Uncharacterized protein n=1 Tax=Brachionus plicatilis TaxID=10195 RepID=A0A3M7QRP0_BRAPC|nr:hypothetical protein BpHYR1_042826 [Brachionus plicatilis]
MNLIRSKWYFKKIILEFHFINLGSLIQYSTLIIIKRKRQKIFALIKEELLKLFACSEFKSLVSFTCFGLCLVLSAIVGIGDAVGK